MLLLIVLFTVYVYYLLHYILEILVQLEPSGRGKLTDELRKVLG